MMEWGTKKIPRASNKTPKNSYKKINPKKSYAEFLRLKNIPNVCVYSFIPSTFGGHSNNTRDTRSLRTF